ncbi:hypothetical protein F5887DRAFT_1072907 [Amanita rubescens]|nr:hypothetical protein F5887DRAFT_1072907 [Amanita rubescens]
MFVKCPHICIHSKTKTASGIIWKKGSTYSSHIQSKSIHPNCDATCPAYKQRKHPHDDVTEEDWRRFGDATFERFFKRKDRNLLALGAIPSQCLSGENQEKLSSVVVQSSDVENTAMVAPGSGPPVAGPSRLSRSPTPARTPGQRRSRSSLPAVPPSPESPFQPFPVTLPAKQRLVTPRSGPPMAGPSRRSRSPTPVRVPSLRRSRSPTPVRTPSLRRPRSPTPAWTLLPPVQPSPGPAFQPSPVLSPATLPLRHDVSIGTTPKPSRTLRDIGVGMTPRPSRTLQDVSIGMTSGILFDVGINTEALSDDEFPITESELGMIEESGILIDGGVGTNALSEDEFDIVPDSEPERIERALANVSQAEPSNPQPQSPQLRSPIPSPVQLPIPSSSPEPQPQTAFHIYAGAFPSQEAAMTNRYYTDSITICIVEDPRLVPSTVENEGEDYWMVKSDSIPSRWMRSFEEGIPQAGKKNACWEWVHVLYALHKKTGSSRLFSLKWTSFKNGLLKQNWKVWEVLKSSDLHG